MSVLTWIYVQDIHGFQQSLIYQGAADLVMWFYFQLAGLAYRHNILWTKMLLQIPCFMGDALQRTIGRCNRYY